MFQSIPVHFELNTCLSALLARAFSASFEAVFLHKRSLRSQSILQNTRKTILQNNKVKYSCRTEYGIIPLSRYKIPIHNYLS